MVDTTPNIRTVLDTTHRELLLLWRRQFAIEAFVVELERVTREEIFDINDELRWIEILDLRDKNIIDFASWARALCSKGGLFDLINSDDHRDTFSSPRKWGLSKSDGSRQDPFDEGYAAARKRLFGEAIGPTIIAKDTEGLRTSFEQRVAPIMHDAANHRIDIYHRVEGTKAEPKMLGDADSRALYEYAHTFLNDLSLVSDGFTFALSNIAFGSTSQHAEEAVDAILLPRYARRLAIRAGIDRQELYGALHAEPHDKTGKPAFNNPDAVHRVLAHLGLVKKT